MQALVTGGTGFVGSHLIETLRAGGDRVRALVRSESNHALVSQLGAEPAVGDLHDTASLVAACADCDVVYHAAARVEIVGDYREFHQTTVVGTQHLLEAARRAGVRRFAYVSSCGIYHPRLLADGVIDEDTPTPTPPGWFIYGRTKLEAEQVVRLGMPADNWVIVRLGYLYGPRNRTMHRYLRPLVNAGPLRLIGDGENEMAMLYVHDAARAIAAAGRADVAGRTLIAAGHEHVTQRQYLNAIADGFGVPQPTRCVPYRVAYCLAWIGEYLARVGLNRDYWLVNRSAIALTGLPQRIDCARSRALLGWEPQVRFADGIRRAFEWYHHEYCGSGLQSALDSPLSPVATRA